MPHQPSLNLWPVRHSIRILKPSSFSMPCDHSRRQSPLHLKVLTPRPRRLSGKPAFRTNSHGKFFVGLKPAVSIEASGVRSRNDTRKTTDLILRSHAKAFPKWERWNARVSFRVDYFGVAAGHRTDFPEVVAMFLTPTQISALYPVSRSTIYAACQSGFLAHYRVPARKGAKGKYLIKEEDLLAWLESFRISPVSCPSTSAPASSGSLGVLFSELDPKKLSRAWKG